MRTMSHKLDWILKEWRTIFTNPKQFIPLLGILLIPVLYSGTYLWAFWDPYAHLETLPVAVVNNDKGVVHSGIQYHLGNDLVDQLKKDKSFAWSFVNSDEAEKGLRSNRYYIRIEIPEDFSANATTLTEAKPKPLQLFYTANVGYNYIVSRIGQSGIEEIRTELSKSIIKNYAETIFKNINDLAAGLTQASAGSNDLDAGITTLNNGTNQLLQALQTKQPQLQELAQGAADLQMNANKLSAGVKQLQLGFNGLLTSANQVQSGTSQLAGGAQQHIALGLGTLSNGMTALGTALSAESSGLDQLAAASRTLEANANTLASLTDKAASSIHAFLIKHPELGNDPDLAGASGASIQAAKGMAGLTDGTKQLVQSSARLSDGAHALQTKQNELIQGVSQLAAGVNQLVQSAVKVDNGMRQLQQGMTSYAGGMTPIVQGNEQLALGFQRLSTGVSQTSAGWNGLIASVAQLNAGEQAAKNGSNALKTKLAEGVDKAASLHTGQMTYEMLSNPVRVAEKPLNQVPNYGTGLAPYFLSISLFVGALLLTTVFSMKETNLSPISPMSWFLNKLLLLFGIGVIQALLACFVLIEVLGVKTLNTGYFILFAILVSLTFMALIQFLVAAFNNVGRFIAIILLVLQLTASAGTFPVELIPHFLQSLHGFLPMSYSVSGFRTIISTGDNHLLFADVLYLMFFMVISIAASMLTFKISFKKLAAAG